MSVTVADRYKAGSSTIAPVRNGKRRELGDYDKLGALGPIPRFLIGCDMSKESYHHGEGTTESHEASEGEEARGIDPGASRGTDAPPWTGW